MKAISTRFFPLFLVLYEMSIYLSNDAYLPALPGMGSALHTSSNWLPFTITLWFAGSFITQLMIGPICERIGRRRTLLLGGLMYVCSSLFCAAANQIWPFLIGRFLQGSSIGSMTVAGYATIHDSFEQQQAIKTIAWMGAISIVGPALGPLIGSGLLSFGNWRFIFLLLATLAAISLIGNFFFMPETRIIDHDKTPTLTSYKRILNNWLYMGQALSLTSGIFIMIGWISAGPWIIHDQFHQSGVYFGIYQAIIFSGFIIGTRSVGSLIKRFGIPAIIQVCMRLSFITGCFSLIFSYFFPANIGLFVGCLFVIALNLGICFPTLNRLTIESSTESMEARVAMFATIVSVTAAIASATIGLIPNISSMALSVIMFIASMIAIVLHRSTKSAM